MTMYKQITRDPATGHTVEMMLETGASLDMVTRQVADELTYSFDEVVVHDREWMSIILCRADVGGDVVKRVEISRYP